MAKGVKAFLLQRTGAHAVAIAMSWPLDISKLESRGRFCTRSSHDAAGDGDILKRKLLLIALKPRPTECGTTSR